LPSLLIEALSPLQQPGAWIVSWKERLSHALPYTDIAASSHREEVLDARYTSAVY
jgi:hypothetical protein